MFLSFVFVFLSAVDASSLVRRDNGRATLRFTTEMNWDAISGRTLAEKDRARAHAMIWARYSAGRNDASIRATNALYMYTTQVGIGEPPNSYTLLIDTGSSNTWVGAHQSRPYISTKTSVRTGNTFNLSYGGANVTGEEMLDTVTLSPDLVIQKQSIGAATLATGQNFQGIDGILGVGPIDQTYGTVNNTTMVPTVLDNLYVQGTIAEEVLGIYFVPSSASNSDGELTFGEVDDSIITGPIEYVPLTTTSPASKFWGVNHTVSYGNEVIQSNAAGVVDTGTTLILLATDAFQKYQKATGAVMDNNIGLLVIDSMQYANLKTLKFNMGGVCLDLKPNAQIWPRSLNTAIGGNKSAVYLIVGDLGDTTDLSIGFIDGYPLLERFYSVYDTTNKRVGFAKTAYTDADIN